MSARDRRIDLFLNAGIWLLFIALLVPAGFVGWEIGRHDAKPKYAQVSPAAHATHVASAAGK
jgi:hypothetical protein